MPSEPRPCFTPAHRASSWTWPWACRTQSTFLAPSDASRLPAATPAMVSSCPKNDIPPHCCQLVTPALNMTTGIPAALACLTVGQMAAGAGSVTAMPLTLLLIASVIS